MKRSLAALAVLGFTSVAVAAGSARAAGEGRSGAAVSVAPGVVDGATARKLVAAGVKVVDVRTADEFAAGHVPGAVNIPHDQMERRYAELGPSSTPLLVYCRTGHRAGLAIETLRKHGFQQIYDLKAYDLWLQSEPPKAKQ